MSMINNNKTVDTSKIHRLNLKMRVINRKMEKIKNYRSTSNVKKKMEA